MRHLRTAVMLLVALAETACAAQDQDDPTRQIRGGDMQQICQKFFSEKG